LLLALAKAMPFASLQRLDCETPHVRILPAPAMLADLAIQACHLVYLSPVWFYAGLQ
jgi:hypothetical protein